MKLQRHSGLLLCLVLVAAGGCRRATTEEAAATSISRSTTSPRDEANEAASPLATLSLLAEIDFGEVCLDEGSQHLTRTVTVQNTRDTTREVATIKTTCGCTGAKLDREILAPGESAVLSIVLDVTAPGTRSESVDLIYSDGSREMVRLRVRGYRSTDISVVPGRVLAADLNRPLEVTFYLVTRDERVRQWTPTLLAPVNASLEFAGWTVIEPFSEARSRPLRCTGVATIKFEEGMPIAPFEIRIAGPEGEDDLIVKAR